MGNRKLKVFSIIPSGFCFGLQHVTVDFFTQFDQLVESHFLVTKWNDGEFPKMLDKNKLHYSYSSLGMFSRKLDFYNLRMSLTTLIHLPKLYYDYVKLIRKLKPDILYFANHHELIILFPVLLFTNCRILCHMHDPPPPICFQKYSFKWYSKKISGFIAISESVRLRTIELGCDPAIIQTIHNGIHIPSSTVLKRENVFCEQAGWSEDVFIIGITGQMTETKGYTDLLEAFKLVHSKNKAARLILGGRRLEPLYAELEEEIIKQNLSSYVFFSGWLPESETFFRNINVYVLASRHDEGYGLVVAEAMAAGIPVVITRSGGAIELVENGVSGYIVEKQNTVEMSERLYELSINTDQCIEMGVNARNSIMTKFNIEIQASKVLNYFEEITNC